MIKKYTQICCDVEIREIIAAMDFLKALKILRKYTENTLSASQECVKFTEINALKAMI